MSENNQTITFEEYLEQYTALKHNTIKTYLKAYKNNNPEQYVNAKNSAKNLYKFYINFLGNTSELESKLRRVEESNEALVQNMNELLRHCAELKEENESLNSIKIASSAKIKHFMEVETRLLDETIELKEELKSYVEEECQTLKKLEAENKELKEQVQVLETVRLANFGRIDELTRELDMLRQGITVLSTEDCNPNHIIALGELDTHVALLQQELEDKEAEFEKAFEEQERRFEKELKAYKGEAIIHRKLKKALINQDHDTQTNTGDTVDINTDKILDERMTRQKIKEQGKAKTRAELKDSGIELENITPHPRTEIKSPRMILITWHSYMQTVIREDDRALEYLIANFDSIENICYVNLETV